MNPSPKNWSCTRREALASIVSGGMALGSALSAPRPEFRLASFVVEVTPPLGHPLMGGGITAAERVDDPLYVHGLVLQSHTSPVVLAAVDWCELRNDAYERWRQLLAEAAGTTRERVLVACLHQHDAPIADLTGQQLLEEHQAKGCICNLEFHEKTVRRVAQALRVSRDHAQPITHIGVGQAKVEQIGSNRRYLGSDGKPRFDRMSATREPAIRNQPEGLIDPFLKTLSFWRGDTPVAAVSSYATHPMSYYGKGGVSADFIGLSRRRRQVDDPRVFQLYFTGCSGNVTAGKHNDGAAENRPVLAERLYQALVTAWRHTTRHPLLSVEVRTTPLRLAARSGPGFTEHDLIRRLKSDPRPFGQCLAALGLSWRKRVETGQAIDLPLLDLGPAQFLLLPAEAYVEYQLLAQRLRPEGFVMTAGYGECGPGYIPTDRHWEEGDTNLADWCWVAPGAEGALREAIERVLRQ